jgi:hypothetical protein
MKNGTPILIRSELDIPDFFLDHIAWERQHLQTGKVLIPSKLKTLEHHSEETYLSGTVEMSMATSQGTDILRIPVLSRFLFTCSNELQVDPEWLICLS